MSGSVLFPTVLPPGERKDSSCYRFCHFLLRSPIALKGNQSLDKFHPTDPLMNVSYGDRPSIIFYDLLPFEQLSCRHTSTGYEFDKDEEVDYVEAYPPHKYPDHSDYFTRVSGQRTTILERGDVYFQRLTSWLMHRRSYIRLPNFPLTIGEVFLHLRKVFLLLSIRYETLVQSCKDKKAGNVITALNDFLFILKQMASLGFEVAEDHLGSEPDDVITVYLIPDLLRLEVHSNKPPGRRIKLILTEYWFEYNEMIRCILESADTEEETYQEPGFSASYKSANIRGFYLDDLKFCKPLQSSSEKKGYKASDYSEVFSALMAIRTFALLTIPKRESQKWSQDLSTKIPKGHPNYKRHLGHPKISMAKNDRGTEYSILVLAPSRCDFPLVSSETQCAVDRVEACFEQEPKTALEYLLQVIKNPEPEKEEIYVNITLDCTMKLEEISRLTSRSTPSKEKKYRQQLEVPRPLTPQQENRSILKIYHWKCITKKRPLISYSIDGDVHTKLMEKICGVSLYLNEVSGTFSDNIRLERLPSREPEPQEMSKKEFDWNNKLDPILSIVCSDCKRQNPGGFKPVHTFTSSGFFTHNPPESPKEEVTGKVKFLSYSSPYQEDPVKKIAPIVLTNPPDSYPQLPKSAIPYIFVPARDSIFDDQSNGLHRIFDTAYWRDREVFRSRSGLCHCEPHLVRYEKSYHFKILTEGFKESFMPIKQNDPLETQDNLPLDDPNNNPPELEILLEQFVTNNWGLSFKMSKDFKDPCGMLCCPALFRGSNYRQPVALTNRQLPGSRVWDMIKEANTNDKKDDKTKDGVNFLSPPHTRGLRNQSHMVVRTLQDVLCFLEVVSSLLIIEKVSNMDIPKNSYISDYLFRYQIKDKQKINERLTSCVLFANIFNIGLRLSSFDDIEGTYVMTGPQTVDMKEYLEINCATNLSIQQKSEPKGHVRHSKTSTLFHIEKKWLNKAYRDLTEKPELYPSYSRRKEAIGNLHPKASPYYTAHYLPSDQNRNPRINLPLPPAKEGSNIGKFIQAIVDSLYCSQKMMTLRGMSLESIPKHKPESYVPTPFHGPPRTGKTQHCIGQALDDKLSIERDNFLGHLAWSGAILKVDGSCGIGSLTTLIGIHDEENKDYPEARVDPSPFQSDKTISAYRFRGVCVQPSHHIKCINHDQAPVLHPSIHYENLERRTIEQWTKHHKITNIDSHRSILQRDLNLSINKSIADVLPQKLKSYFQALSNSIILYQAEALPKINKFKLIEECSKCGKVMSRCTCVSLGVATTNNIFKNPREIDEVIVLQQSPFTVDDYEKVRPKQNIRRTAI